MKDLLRISLNVMKEIDLRVLPAGLAVNVAATCKLIEKELEPAPVAKKAAKKKAKKKVSKKK